MRIRIILTALAAAFLLPTSCEENKYGDWTYVCTKYYGIESGEARETILNHVAKDTYFASPHQFSGPKDECGRNAATEFFTHTHALGDSVISSNLDTLDYFSILLYLIPPQGDSTAIASTSWIPKSVIDEIL